MLVKVVANGGGTVAHVYVFIQLRQVNGFRARGRS